MIVRRLETGAMPGVGAVDAPLPPGLVAFLGGDGTRREALRRLLAAVLAAGEAGSPGGAAAAEASLDGADSGTRVEVRGTRGEGTVALSGAWDGRRLRLADGGGVVEPRATVGTPEGALDEEARRVTAWMGGARLGQMLARLDVSEARETGGEDEEGDEEGRHRVRLETELEAIRERVAALEDAPLRLRSVERELRELRADAAEITGDLEVARMDWLRERQDAETHLQAYRDRARELKARLAQMDPVGPDTPCPTCGRPLGDHGGPVLGELREEWEGVVQDGQWWKRRREQLELKPEGLQQLEGRALRVQAALEAAAERAEGSRAAARELERLRLREGELERRLSRPPGTGEGDPGAGDGSLALDVAEARRLLLDDVRLRILRRAGRHLNRLSGGILLGMEKGEGGRVRVLEPGGARSARGQEERAAVTVTIRLAAEQLAVEAGAPPGALLLGPEVERMEPEARLRLVDLLVRPGSRFAQVLLVTGTDVVSRRPEAFAAAFQLRQGVPERALRPLSVGLGRIRLGG